MSSDNEEILNALLDGKNNYNNKPICSNSHNIIKIPAVNNRKSIDLFSIYKYITTSRIVQGLDYLYQNSIKYIKSQDQILSYYYTKKRSFEYLEWIFFTDENNFFKILEKVDISNIDMWEIAFFKFKNWEKLKILMKKFTGKIPEIFTPLQNSTRLVNWLRYSEFGYGHFIEVVNPDTIKHSINGYNALMICFKYQYAILSNINVVNLLISPDTIKHIDKNGWNPLMYYFRYFSNPKWINIAKQLITPETIKQVTKGGFNPYISTPDPIKQISKKGWNPLMYYLRYCTDPKWIEIANQLITPETIKQVNKDGRNPLMFCLHYCTDPKWIEVAKQLITSETIKIVNFNNENILSSHFKHCATTEWLDFIKLPAINKTLINNNLNENHPFRQYIQYCIDDNFT